MATIVPPTDRRDGGHDHEQPSGELALGGNGGGAEPDDQERAEHAGPAEADYRACSFRFEGRSDPAHEQSDESGDHAQGARYDSDDSSGLLHVMPPVGSDQCPGEVAGTPRWMRSGVRLGRVGGDVNRKRGG